MRVYTNRERELLIRLNDGEASSLYSLIDPWTLGASFKVNISTNDVEITLEQDLLQSQGISLNERIQEMQITLLESVNLLKLFEDKGYIFIFKSSNTIPNPFIFGQATFTNASSPYHFPDTRMSELIAKYATQEIFITPELNQFVRVDNFRTREAVRADRQYRVTLTALIIAIFALLINLVFNIRNSTNTSNSDTKKNKTLVIPHTSRHG
jgi:hypothetical protein